jgi:hypothetical protein
VEEWKGHDMERSGEDMKLNFEFICDWIVDKRGERLFVDVWRE